MKRKFVTRLLSGVTTAVVTVSSMAAPVMAAPEDGTENVSFEEDEEEFVDYLEENFEEEAEDEYVEEDAVEEIAVEEEDAEIVMAGSSTIRTNRTTVYAIKGKTTQVDIMISGAAAERDAENHTTYALTTSIPIGLSTKSLEEDGQYDSGSGNETYYEHVINCSKAGTFKIQYGTSGASAVEVTVIVYEESDVIKIDQTDFTFKQGQEGVKTFTVTSTGNSSYHYDYPDGSDNTYTIDVDLVEGTSSFWFSEDSGQMGNPVALVDADRVNSCLKFYIGETGTTSGKIVAYSSSYGYAYMPITITVLPADVLVSGVALNKATLDMTVGGQQTLTATVSPADATNKKVIWSTSNAAVATVDENGKVTAMAKGSALITATTEDGNKTASCAVSVSDATVSVSGVSLDQTSLSLKPGDIEVLTATVSPTNASNTNVTFSSSNTSVATVNNIGIVTAKAAGTATITVKTADGNKTATCTVTVSNPTVAVTGVILDKTSVSLVEGDTATLQATVSPSNATNKAVTFTTSNDHVATVSAGGAIVAIAPGTATITATTADGSKTANCLVTVTAKTVSVTGVTLNKTIATLTEGETLALTATVAPANATNPAVTYTSSNADVASVSADGVVTAKAAGEAMITVTTKDGSKTATCKITVNAATVAVTGVSLNRTTTALEAGESVTLTATVAPSNATNQGVTWTSDNISVATVDANGKVTAVAAGNATITVKTADGEKTAACSVTVKAKSVAVNGVSIDKKEVELKISDTVQLTAVVSPTDADYQKISWKSDDPAVANVDSTGKVTALTAGSTTIRATVVEADGRDYLYNASCKVTVTGQEANTAEKTTEAINNLPSASDVKPEDKNAIEQAKEQYDNLPKSEQEKVAPEVVQKLNDAIAALESALEKKEAEDTAAAKAVTDLINALPSADQITEANKDAVQAAKEAFEKLTDDQKAKLDNNTVNKLAEAVEGLKDIIAKTDEEKAGAVAEQISNLPAASDVTKENQQEIEQAKQDFENLTESQKALIDDETVKKLEDVIVALKEAIKNSEETDAPTFKYNEETEAWDYYVGGEIDYDYYGFVDYEGYKFLVANGQIAAVNGLAMDPNSDLWYFCAEGQVVKHTGLVRYNEEWFYVKDGVLDTGLNALVPYNGGLFYVAAGRITREVSGLVLDPNGSGWYFVALGEVQNQYTGLATYNGAWFYVIKGRLADDYTGVVTYDNQLFNVVNGMVY